MVTKGIGIPIKLLHESEGHVVTVAAHVTTSAERTNTMLDAQVELKSGETYRGDLHDAEDNWNVQLTDVTATARVRFTVCTDRVRRQWVFVRAGW